MNLLLGVSGGIAAYKACELCSAARHRGWSVRVVMTPSATRFVGPLSFEALTNHPVMTDALASGHGAGPDAVEHIGWARWADVAAVVPLTANTMARLAHGLADDALSTVFLALGPEVPVVLAPAMNTRMWEHPATARNRDWLASVDRYHFVEPITKRLACGEVGIGALAAVDEIVEAIASFAD